MGRRVLKFLASLNLAVVIIILLAIISAAGTFVEAHFNDARAAQVLVFHAWYMWATLILLAVNLTAVMVDRWPWRIHHSGFVSAHIGILLLLLGSVLTYFYGIDGSMRFPLGGKSRFISLPETDIVVYASMDGDNFTKVFESPVQFLKTPPTADNPFVVDVFADGAEEGIQVIDFVPYALVDQQIVQASSKSLKKRAAVRFQLFNDQVNLTKWSLQKKDGGRNVLNLGPARVTLSSQSCTQIPKTQEGNEVALYSFGDPKKLCYAVFHKGQRKKMGLISVGDLVETGWMGLKFRLLKYFDNASEETRVRPVTGSGELTSPVVKVRFKGKDYWLAQNAMLRFFHKETAYLFFYQNRRLGLDFEIELKKFEVGRYQGTMRAASYQSLVSVVGEPGETLISMNEPLKYKGLTFYQASFESDEEGQPVASILSVNYDPGRFLKYLGSFLIVLGTTLMFYFKKMIVESWRKRKREIV